VTEVKQNKFLGIRLSDDLSLAIERERRRAERESGFKIKTSEFVRATLEKQFSGKRRSQRRAA